MNAREAIETMKQGLTVSDEMDQYYNLIPEDERSFFGDGEEVYRGRKTSGEFISIEEFLTINQDFKTDERKSQ